MNLFTFNYFGYINLIFDILLGRKGYFKLIYNYL